MTDIDLKGLEDLDFLISSKKTTSIDSSYKYVPINALKPSPHQPRKKIGQVEIQELAESIKSQGIIQPIIVRIVDNFYEIIAGERRWRAAQLAGLIDVPIIIKNVPDSTVIAFALIENTQRQDLNVVDEAKSIRRLVDEFSMTHESIGQLLGKSRSSISNIIRILNLPDNLLLMLEEGHLEKGHAKLLVGLDDQKLSKIQKILEKRKLTVREIDYLIAQIDDLKSPVNLFDVKVNEQVNNWQERLSNILHSQVRVKVNKEGRGKILINVNSTQEIDWLINKLEHN